ncbi:MAG: hypothetical protein ACERKK_00900 [Poseidonibacter sp.]|uniref:hypothetical protein n=1 Tax=Poseidonibacter sp. TaxID=2321188 RepID=UPI00359E3A17
MSITINSCMKGIAIATLPLLLTACANQEKIDNTNKLTVGKVQLDFVRMNNNDFAIAGGIAAAGGVAATAGSGILFATIASVGALTFLSSNSNETIETQQKTLTVILDFNKNEELKDFSYMYSSF